MFRHSAKPLTSTGNLGATDRRHSSRVISKLTIVRASPRGASRVVPFWRYPRDRETAREAMLSSKAPDLATTAPNSTNARARTPARISLRNPWPWADWVSHDPVLTSLNTGNWRAETSCSPMARPSAKTARRSVQGSGLQDARAFHRDKSRGRYLDPAAGRIALPQCAAMWPAAQVHRRTTEAVAERRQDVVAQVGQRSTGVGQVPLWTSSWTAFVLGRGRSLR